MRELSPARIIAYENIPPYTPVTFDGRIANSADVSGLSRLAGISREVATVRGQVIDYLDYGELQSTNFNWVADGDIYLNGSVLSQTPASDNVQFVGVAKSAKVMFVLIGTGSGTEGPAGPTGPQGPQGPAGQSVGILDGGDADDVYGPGGIIDAGGA